MNEFIPRDNDAWAIIRGFVYQVDLTIERWIHLTDGQILELERGEDIDLVTRCLVSPEQERERLLEQVKHRDKNLTLRKPAAIEAVVNFFEHRRINPNLHLLFQYTTNAQVTAERPAMMPNNEPAIAVWESIRCGIYPQDHVARAIQGFQTIFREAFESRQRASGTKDRSQWHTKSTAWQKFIRFFENSDEGEIVRFIRRFRWSTGAPSAEDVGPQIRGEFLQRGTVRDEEEARLLYDRLFLYVFKLLSKRGIKRLTSAALNEELSLPSPKRSDQELLATLITARVNAESIEQLRQANPAYAHVEHLFVHPQQYEDICSKLDNQNLVCIAGEPHMGKTFTAVRLLCDYAQRGYRVRLGLGTSYEDEYGRLSISGRYRWSGYRDERDLDKFVEPGQISCIEDPYGISDEDLDYSRARFHLGVLIDKLNELPSDPFQRPPKIIITMRRAILENILPEYPSLLDHVIKLQETSYTREDRRAILDRYIEWIRPSWSEDEQTRQKVLPMVPDELVAPHNIYWLVSQTRRSPSLSMQDVANAKEIIDAVTTELSLLPELEQLVFISIYITNSEPHVKRFPRFSPLGRDCYSNFSVFSDVLGFDEEHAREAFEKVVTKWSSMIAASSLSSIGTEFQHLASAAFLHDSYIEAVGEFIRRNATKGIFAELASRMLELINEDKTRNAGLALAYPSVTHFQSVRSGLIKKIEPLLKSEDKYTRQTAAEALLSNYQHLPEELKNLIDKLDAATDCEMWYLIMRTAWPNHRLSHEDQITLWEKALLGGTICPPDLVLHPLEGLLLSYRSLSPELKRLIHQQLGSDDQYTWYCYAAALVRTHKYLPREMQTYLHKLAEHGTEPILYEIIHAIASHYASLPEEIRAILEKYVTASSWKLRAYVVAAYRLFMREATPEHARLIEHHALHDPDARVRLSHVYVHLHLSRLEGWRFGRDVSPDELHLFNAVFFSEVDIDKAGVLFSLLHTYNEWKTCERAATYRERLKELLYDSTPLVMAMIKLKMQDDYPNDLPKPPAARLDDSLLDALRKETQALAEGLVHICYGPLSGQQS